MRYVVRCSAALTALAVAQGPSPIGAQDGVWWEWTLAAPAPGAGPAAGVALFRLPERDLRGVGRGDRHEDRYPRDDAWGAWGDDPYDRDDGGRARSGERWEDRSDVYHRGPPAARTRARGNGPPFCRSGAGHPVHGRRWCMERGWGPGSRPAWRWEPRRWDDVWLNPAWTRPGMVLHGRDLAHVLGRVVFARLRSEMRGTGRPGPLDGRWLRRGGAVVLQIRAGGFPFAELTDLDRDRRADVVLVATR